MSSTVGSVQIRSANPSKRTSRRIRDLFTLKHSDSRHMLNTTGLPALPPDILYELLVHFLQPSIPAVLEIPYPFPLTEHRRAIWSLSRTCRRLREVFWPRLWVRIEVASMYRELYLPPYITLSEAGVVLKVPAVVHDTSIKEKQRISWEISSRFKWLLSGGSSMRPLVTSMNLWITDFNQAADRIKVLSIILTEAYLPNLRTVQLIFDAHNLVSGQIMGVELFKCFPNVRTAVALCNHPCMSEISPFLQVVTDHCKKIKVLDGIPHQKGAVQTVIRAFPGLQEIFLGIDLEGFFFPEEISEISQLKSLMTINLREFYRPIYSTFRNYGASATGAPRETVRMRIEHMRQLVQQINAGRQSNEQLLLNDLSV